MVSKVQSSKHPAILKFPAQADRIAGLMSSDEEFYSICSDYEQIVSDIARTEKTTGCIGGRFQELLQLRSDLESDIVDWLNRTGPVQSNEQDRPNQAPEE